MTYNLNTHRSEVITELHQIFPMKTSCEIVDKLIERGCQAVRIDIDEDSEITLRVGIIGIKDYFRYSEGNKPKE